MFDDAVRTVQPPHQKDDVDQRRMIGHDQTAWRDAVKPFHTIADQAQTLEDVNEGAKHPRYLPAEYASVSAAWDQHVGHRKYKQRKHHAACPEKRKCGARGGYADWPGKVQ